MYNEEMLDFLKQINPNITDVDIKLNYIRVACGMKIPGIENLKIEKPVSKLDIKPTFKYLVSGNEEEIIGGEKETAIEEEKVNEKIDGKEEEIKERKNKIRKEVSLGTNMFARKDFISLNNERIVTSRYYFDEKWYKRIDGQEVEQEGNEISEEERKLLEEYYNDMKQELAISTSISINNLLK